MSLVNSESANDLVRAGVFERNFPLLEEVAIFSLKQSLLVI